MEAADGDDLAANAVELDLTNAHLPSLDEVDLNPKLKTLDLTANRLRHLEPKVQALTGLTRLSLRQNLITNPAEVEALASAAALEHLEVRDNQLPAAPDLRTFTSLRYLELSYNEIRSLAPLAELQAPLLEELYAACNKVTTIEGVSQLTSLRVLELGSNRIGAIEGLATLGLLRELWLGRNRITQIANMGALPSLRKLSLQSNRLASMQGLQACTALEELYLSHNGIERLEGLDSLVNLKILDVANNRLASLAGLGALTDLTDLWANDNAIASLDDVETELKQQRGTLSCLYLHGNPCAADERYKLRVRHLLPKLEQLDDNPV